MSTDINLDGLVANTEQTRASTEPPLRRVAQRFDFPQLTKPGVYVVDFIGSGKSSRAPIRKGRLAAARRDRHGRIATLRSSTTPTSR